MEAFFYKNGSGRAFDLVAIGRAYVDALAHVPFDFLAHHGVELGAGPRLDEEGFRKIHDAAMPYFRAPGGTGANSLAAVAALGGKAKFFGKVAHDDEGALFVADFEKRGVVWGCTPFADQGTMTGSCLVLLTKDGARSFVLQGGCADAFSKADFEGVAFDDAAFVLFDAEILTLSQAAPLVREAAARAKKHSKLAVNVHNLPSWVAFPEIAFWIAREADILIGNEREIQLLREVVSFSGDSDQVVVTTMGDKGAEARWGGCNLFVPAVKPSAFKSSVGAGDAFTGGLLFALSQGQEIGDALRQGALVAAKVIECEGARVDL